MRSSGRPARQRSGCAERLIYQWTRLGRSQSKRYLSVYPLQGLSIDGWAAGMSADSPVAERVRAGCSWCRSHSVTERTSHAPAIGDLPMMFVVMIPASEFCRWAAYVDISRVVTVLGRAVIAKAWNNR